MSIFGNTVELKDFVFNPKTQVVKTKGKGPFSGHIYLLLSVISEGVAFKVGRATDLDNRMKQYLSAGSRYEFSRCIEFRAKSKEDLNQILKDEEDRIINKIKVNKNFKSRQGREHFLLPGEADILLANKDLILEIEKIFEKEEVKKGQKFKLDNFKGIYFHESVFPEQLDGGVAMFDAFKSGNHLVNLHSRTQSGKTGAIMTAAASLVQDSWNNKVRPPKIIIATPLNDKEWKAQTITRIPMVEDLRFSDDRPLVDQKNLMILSDLLKYIKNLEEIETPTYIFFDEYQRATKKGQTIDKFLNQVFKLNTDLFGQTPKEFMKVLKEKQIYFGFISATDFYMNWLSKEDFYAEHFKNIELSVSKKYVSWESYYNSGLINDVVKIYDDKFGSLTSRFKEEMDSFLRLEDTKKYILVRKETKLNIDTLKDALKEEYGDKIQILEHHGENKIDANLLKFKPPIPTFIILKDYWRAAKTLNAEHVGMVFDRFLSNPHLQSVDTVLQGLLGRLTGYKKRLNIKIFTNKQVLEAFLNKDGIAKLDLKTAQMGKDMTKNQETHRENIVLKIPEDILENFIEKDLEKWIRGMERYKSRKRPIIRLIPKQTKRLLTNGKLKSFKDVDPEFFKNGSKSSVPSTLVVSGAMNSSSDTILWVNYDPERPKLVKITEIFYEARSESNAVPTAQGVLGFKS